MNKFNVTLTFNSPIIDPVIRVFNFDGSLIEFYTSPSTLLYTNGQLIKTGNRYSDADGSGSPDLNKGGSGSIAFTGTYSTIKWYAPRTPS